MNQDEIFIALLTAVSFDLFILTTNFSPFQRAKITYQQMLAYACMFLVWAAVMGLRVALLPVICSLFSSLLVG